MKKILFAVLICIGTQINAQVTFTNVSDQVGIDYKGRSYGASWGDINGDGWLDIFTSCHFLTSEPFFENDYPRIWLNANGDSFDDGVYTVDAADQADTHGAVIFDFDNDGDKDIFLLTGGTKRNVFLRNDNTFEMNDFALELNLGLDLGRGRQSTCMDINGDGFTDLIINNEEPVDDSQPPSTAMVKNFGQGYDLFADQGFEPESSDVSFISDLNGNGKMDLAVMNLTNVTIMSVDNDGFFTTETVLPYNLVRDVVIADFDGDLLPDIFLTRGRKNVTEVKMLREDVIQSVMRLPINQSNTTGCDFTLSESVGELKFQFFPLNPVGYTLHVGSSVVMPLSGWSIETIAADAPILQGFQEPEDGLTGYHIYIGIDENNLWKMRAFNFSNTHSVAVEITTEATFENFVPYGNAAQVDQGIKDVLLINQGNYVFTPSTDPAFQQMYNTMSVVAADFDNDMDLDMYVLSTGTALNRPDYIYENLGNGQFTIHENGWGIVGEEPGVGDAVTTADYNNDGFMDLFVLNGSMSLYLDSARYILYKNGGNTNNWIKLYLKGTESTADGFGAKVQLSAGGTIQLREMNGGIHSACQDDPRLHFGLAQSTAVDSILVYWPSGLVDAFYGVQSNQIMDIVEGSSPLNTFEGARETPYIYPNPSTDGNLRLHDPSNAVSQIIVYDMHGRKLRQVSTASFQGLNFQLNLLKGVYMLELKDKNVNTLCTIRWVVG